MPVICLFEICGFMVFCFHTYLGFMVLIDYGYNSKLFDSGGPS